MVSSGVETVQGSFIILSQVTIMINVCFFIQHVKVCIDSPLLSHLLGTFLFCHL